MTKFIDLTKNRVSNKTDLYQTELDFLKEKCQNKNLIINILLKLITNILLKQLFHTGTSKPLNTGDPDNPTKTVNENNYKCMKRAAKASNLSEHIKNLIHTTNRFSVLSHEKSATDAMHKDTSLDHIFERSVQTDKNSSNYSTTFCKTAK